MVTRECLLVRCKHALALDIKLQGIGWWRLPGCSINEYFTCSLSRNRSALSETEQAHNTPSHTHTLKFVELALFVSCSCKRCATLAWWSIQNSGALLQHHLWNLKFCITTFVLETSSRKTSCRAMRNYNCAKRLFSI